MAYKSLYRKYRPSTFEDVSGQEFIVKTLKNAILNGKIGHAYLFTGTRGTGKTTIAKIFSKSVNCMNPINNMPCGKCEICKNENIDEIQDIIEIDAASNNGVDEIRELKNKIKLVPVYCKYKVYIIDEVHMLSTGAFNALLKTLEEPPEHVIFILATTEPQKIPITIISRCQRFDFKKLSLIDIEKRLKYIATKEKIDITDDGIEEIALMSDGAMRDAIGILDQASSFQDNKITIDDIYVISGSVPKKEIYELILLLINKSVDELLNNIEKLYMEGKDFSILSEDMLHLLRSVLISKKAPIYFEKQSLTTKNFVNELSDKMSTCDLELIIKRLEDLLKEIKSSNYPRILFELFILKDISVEKEETICIEPLKEQQLEIDKKVPKSKENTDSKINIISNDYTNETKIEFDEENKEYKKAYINNTIALANTKEKKSVQILFEQLDKYLINKKYKDAATILKDANIVAASEDHILVTYKYASMVSDNDKKIIKIKELIKVLSNKDYVIIAITDDEWKEARPYYVELKKKNNKIELMEETQPESLIFEKKDSYIDEVSDIINTFGSELVEMKG